MTLRTVFPMSWRSPSVKVIGSMASFEALTFFLGPNLSVMHGCLSCVDVVPGSTLPSAISVSSASFLEDVAWPSSIVASIFCAATAASVAFFCSVAFYVASRTSLTSVTAFLFYLLLTSWVTRNLTSCFCFCAVDFLAPSNLGCTIQEAMSPIL